MTDKEIKDLIIERAEGFAKIHLNMILANVEKIKNDKSMQYIFQDRELLQVFIDTTTFRFCELTTQKIKPIIDEYRKRNK